MYDAHNVDLSIVCVKSLGLGAVMTVNVHGMVTNFEPHVNLYIFLLCMFHLLEFLTTCIFNVSQVDDDSFILTDYELLLVNGATIIEYFITRYFTVNTNSWYLQWFALALIVLGQSFRTLAMATAKQSFNHYVQRTKLPAHTLVTHGVYKLSRHPSYFGFFWWFIGLRLFMNSWLILVYGGYKIWHFFKHRIDFEEEFLVEFFPEYNDYKKQVAIGIPFL